MTMIFQRTHFEVTTTCCADAFLHNKLDQPNLAKQFLCCNWRLQPHYCSHPLSYHQQQLTVRNDGISGPPCRWSWYVYRVYAFFKRHWHFVLTSTRSVYTEFHKKEPLIFDYISRISWSIFIILPQMETGMNTPLSHEIYLLAWWRHNCVTSQVMTV